MAADYIPAGDQPADDWAQNFAGLITTSPATYGLTAGDATVIQTAADDFNTSLAIALAPSTRTPAAVAQKDVDRATMESTCRPFAIQIRNNPAVTDQQRIDLGITVPATTRTPIPPPSSAPAMALDAIQPGFMRLAYTDTAQPVGKAKPDGSIGVEIWVKVDAAADLDPANASYRLTATKSPFDLTFTAPEAGSVASIFGRFVTRSGPAGISQVGPWSVMLSANIA